jgi:preprotein translocase subunit SecF
MIKVGGKAAAKNSAKYEHAIALIKSELEKHVPEIQYRKIDYVGPQIGKDLFYNGAYAALFSFMAIFAYIWLRFEWQFGLGLILALMHDTIATLGFMSLGLIEFNLTSIAAILTVVGYSVNDSVVIYDRIRENLRKYPKKGISELINMSLNETIFRTFLTISTTLLANLSLIVFAGEALRSFSLVVFSGIIIGTYSSIYISAPILIYFNLKPNSK